MNGSARAQNLERWIVDPKKSRIDGRGEGMGGGLLPRLLALAAAPGGVDIVGRIDSELRIQEDLGGSNIFFRFRRLFFGLAA